MCLFFVVASAFKPGLRGEEFDYTGSEVGFEASVCGVGFGVPGLSGGAWCTCRLGGCHGFYFSSVDADMPAG
jgi:hypothetical protein